MASKRKVLFGVACAEAVEHNRRLRKLSRKAQRAAKAVVTATKRREKTATAAWKAWKKMARELSAEVAVLHSSLQLVRHHGKKES